MQAFLPFIDKGIDAVKMLLYIIDYFAFTITEGDWLNDTLTYLPLEMRPYLIEMGQAIAPIFEALYK